MRFGVFAFFQALRSLVRLGWLFFLGLRLFFAVVGVLRVIARHCIAFCHASDAGWGVSYWQCVVHVRAELWRARGGCAGWHVGCEHVRLALGVPFGERACDGTYCAHGDGAAAQQPYCEDWFSAAIL